MRARRARLLGRLVVVGWAALLAALAVDAVREPDHERPTPSSAAGEAAASFVDAWERSRLATFVTVGTYRRHSEVTGAEIASEDVLAQRPPRRLHRQLGGVDGRDDDRLLVCPAPPPGQDPAPCHLGPPGGPTYEESVAREVAGLEDLVLGDDPLYAVTAGDPGCYELDLRRADPRAPFGIAATFCFDDETGAPTLRRVQHPEGVVEELVVTTVRAEVTDADLEPPEP
ncbi:MAG TPA: hypothetical protein VK007_01215 [Acidimicrobiales bacterium]|nr:hypothetical protein [Acidimicrobiales bacterium]